jgi:hypothetical protein
MAGVIWLVFDVVVGPPVSHVAALLTIGLFTLLWAGLPIFSRRH